MEDEILEQVRMLFQESYSAIYKDGAFDTLSDQIEETGDVANPVSQLVSHLVSSVVQDAEVTNLEVLYGLSLLLVSDLLDSLQKEGHNIEGVSLEEIIALTTQMVITANPQIGDAIQQNPEIQQMLQQQQQPQQQQPQQQGVLGGGGV